MKKQTAGQVSTDLLLKTPDTLSPIDIQRATEQEYLRNLEWAVKHELKEVECLPACKELCTKRSAADKDFYVSVLLKKEKKLENILRNYFVVTKDCPTPYFDQTVYKYHYKKGDVQYLWTVPDQETALTFKQNKKIIVPAERPLLQFVLDYYDGNLHRFAKKLNGETMEAGGALIV